MKTPPPPQRVLITDDYPVLDGTRSRVRRMLALTFQPVLLFELKRAIRRSRSQTLISAPDMLAQLGATDKKTIPYTAVLARGLLQAHDQDLVAFSRNLVQIAERLGQHRGAFCQGVSIPEVIQLRMVLGNLLELLAKPAEGIAKILEELGCEELETLTASSLPEIFARCIATHRGIPVKKTPPAPFLKWVSEAKRRRFLGRDRMPPIEVITHRYNDRSLKDASRTPLSGRVLFFAIEERRLRRSEIMADALKTVGISSTIASFTAKKENDDAMTEMRTKGHSCVFLNEFLSLEEAQALAPKSYADAKALWREIEKVARQELPHHYLGIPIFETFAPMFRGVWSKTLLEGVLFIESASRVLQKERPSLVVLFDVGLQSMALLQICKKLGIPTAFYLYNPLLFTVDFWMPILLDSVTPDYILTGTDFMQSKFSENGRFRSDRVFTIGDVLLNSGSPPNRLEAKKQILGPLGISPPEKVVMAISGYVAQDLTIGKKKRFLTGIHAAVKKINGARLLIKAHPNENIDELKNQLKEWEIDAVVVHTASLKDLLLATDLACMMFSQAGLEVVLAGTPLLIIQEKDMIQEYDQWMPFIAQGAASYVSDENDPYETIRSLLLDETRRAKQIEAGYRFAERYVSVLDGASDRHTIGAVRGMLRKP